MDTPDYFQFFGLDRKLALDLSDLEKRFYRLSRQLHPDRYLRATPAEQQKALEASALLNDAYRTLRDPVARAEYFLSLRGLGSEDARNRIPAELLEEVFELNLAVEELRGGDASLAPQVEAARRRFLALREESDVRLEGLFRRYDASGDAVALEEMRATLDRRKYVANLLASLGPGSDPSPDGPSL